MGDDLVKRLRGCPYGTKQTDALLVEAADRIEVLKTQLAHLAIALSKAETAARCEAHVAGEVVNAMKQLEAQLAAARNDALEEAENLAKYVGLLSVEDIRALRTGDA